MLFIAHNLPRTLKVDQVFSFDNAARPPPGPPNAAQVP